MPSYPPIPWKRHRAPYNMHQWVVGIQWRRILEHANPPIESMRDGNASCCSLNIKNCTREESRLWKFYDGVVVEVFVNNSGGIMTLDFPGFSPFLERFSVVPSLTALVVVLVDSLSALLASLAFWLRILFFSFFGSNVRSAKVNSSSTTTMLSTNLTLLGSTLSQVAVTSSPQSGRLSFHTQWQPSFRCGADQIRI